MEDWKVVQQRRNYSILKPLQEMQTFHCRTWIPLPCRMHENWSAKWKTDRISKDNFPFLITNINASIAIYGLNREISGLQAANNEYKQTKLSCWLQNKRQVTTYFSAMDNKYYYVPIIS
jgi:hypothetical protein